MLCTASFLSVERLPQLKSSWTATPVVAKVSPLLKCLAMTKHLVQFKNSTALILADAQCSSLKLAHKRPAMAADVVAVAAADSVLAQVAAAAVAVTTDSF
jgi:hypothetical protein